MRGAWLEPRTLVPLSDEAIRALLNKMRKRKRMTTGPTPISDVGDQGPPVAAPVKAAVTL